MKPVDQTVFGYPNGNCFAACVASLLELPIEEMPSIEGKGFYVVWEKWLAERGLAIADIPAGSGSWIPGLSIVTGKSPRGGVTASGKPTLHAVVARDMKLIHDPHPDRSFIDGPPTEYTVIYPLDPAAGYKRPEATDGTPDRPLQEPAS